MLSVVGSEGVLDGKIVYLHGAHGLENNNGNWVYHRPANPHKLVEDLGNQDQASLVADSLFRAGATVVPLRPVGHQLNEVVLDNSGTTGHGNGSVAFTGEWSVGGNDIYFGPSGSRYQTVRTSAIETAVARFTPEIVTAGKYPIYSWAPSGEEFRASDQLYRINHAEGTTEVTVDHRMVGNGYVYLGTYFFQPGTTGNVEISNRSSDLRPNAHVVADGIRFGNGTGPSGSPREDEAALYWMTDQINGVPESTYRGVASGAYNPDHDPSANIRAPSRWAAAMNTSETGDFADRIFLGLHTNAPANYLVDATPRGTLSVSYDGDETVHQEELGDLLADRIVSDFAAIGSPPLEHEWGPRRTDLAGFYGEIANHQINDEFAASIIEIGFHTNQKDAELLRDPKVRTSVARSILKSTVSYFAQYSDGIRIPDHQFSGGEVVTYGHAQTDTAIGGLTAGNSYFVIHVDSDTIRLANTEAERISHKNVNFESVGTGEGHFLQHGATTIYFNPSDAVEVGSNVTAPEPVASLSAISQSDGTIRISWQAGSAGGVYGDSPEEFRIFVSEDGTLFEELIRIPASSTSYHYTPTNSALLATHFRIVAYNSGGVSEPSSVVSARTGDVSSEGEKILVVNGFHRNDRTLNEFQQYGDGTVERVRPDVSNSGRHVVRMVTAMTGDAPIDSVNSNSVTSALLQNYQNVFWILGEQSSELSGTSSDAALSDSSQFALSQFVSGGGNLFISGADLGDDLVRTGDSFFLTNTLRASFVQDNGFDNNDADTTDDHPESPNAIGFSESIFSGLNVTFGKNNVFYRQSDGPDEIGATNGSVPAFAYGGLGSTAGIQHNGQGGAGNVVAFGFPFEDIVGSDVRAAVMNRVLNFFGIDPIGECTAPAPLTGQLLTAGIQQTSHAASACETGSAEVTVSEFQSPQHAQIGGTVALPTRITNLGAGTSGPTTLEIELIEADGTSLSLDRFPVPGIAAFESFTFVPVISVNSEATPGSYHFRATVNPGPLRDFAEEEYQNNSIRTQTATTLISTPPANPDLQANSLVLPSTAIAGETALVSVSIQNVSSGPAEASFAQVLIPQSPELVLHSFAVPSLAAGELYTTTIDVPVPSHVTPAEYEFLLRLNTGDSPINETSTTNNEVLSSATIDIQAPASGTADLKAALVTPRSSSAEVGRSVVADLSVENLTSTSTDAFSVRILFSRDRRASSGDIEAVTIVRSAGLAANQTDNWAQEVPVPATLEPGAYYLVIEINPDGAVPETSSHNNTFVSRDSIQILASDTTSELTGINIEVRTDDPEWGSEIVLANDFRNDGDGVYPGGVLEFVLSDSSAFSAGSTEILGSRTVGSMAPGRTSGSNAGLTLPQARPAGFGGTQNHIGIRIDGEVLISTQLSITDPAPITNFDILGVDFDVRPLAVIEWGATVEADVRFVNAGTQYAADFYNAIFISEDATLDASDHMLHEYFVEGIAVGGPLGRTEVFSLPGAPVDGFDDTQSVYFLHVSDWRNDLDEGVNEANNSGQQNGVDTRQRTLTTQPTANGDPAIGTFFAFPVIFPRGTDIDITGTDVVDDSGVVNRLRAYIDNGNGIFDSEDVDLITHGLTMSRLGTTFTGELETNGLAIGTWDLIAIAEDPHGNLSPPKFFTITVEGVGVAAPDAYEYNNTRSAAYFLGSESSTTIPDLSITEGDFDWFSFAVTQDADATIRIDFFQESGFPRAPGDLSIELYRRGSNSNLGFQNTSSPGQTFEQIVRNLGNGVYDIGIRADGSTNSNDNYTLSIDLQLENAGPHIGQFFSDEDIYRPDENAFFTIDDLTAPAGRSVNRVDLYVDYDRSHTINFSSERLGTAQTRFHDIFLEDRYFTFDAALGGWGLGEFDVYAYAQDSANRVSFAKIKTITIANNILPTLTELQAPDTVPQESDLVLHARGFSDTDNTGSQSVAFHIDADQSGSLTAGDVELPGSVQVSGDNFMITVDTSGLEVATYDVLATPFDGEDHGPSLSATVEVIPAQLSPITIDSVTVPKTVLLGAPLPVEISGIHVPGGGTPHVVIRADSNQTGRLEPDFDNIVAVASDDGSGTFVASIPEQKLSDGIMLFFAEATASGATPAIRQIITTVERFNHSPTVDPIVVTDVLPADGSLQTIALTGISAGDGENQTLRISVNSNNPIVVPHPEISYLSPQTDAELSFTSASGGTARIEVIVSDAGFDGIPGNADDSSTRQNFELTINAAGFSISETDDNTQVSERGSTDTFTVVLDSQPQTDVVLSVSSSDPGEASVDKPMLTFTPDNWDQTQTVTVTGVDDGLVDGDADSVITVAVDAAASDDSYDSVADATLNVTTIDDGLTVTAVRVRLTDTDYLQLDEVQVLEAVTGTNVALTGTAVQSGTYDHNATASKASDGNTDAGYPVSGAITNLEYGAWWRVDFGRAVDVGSIVIHNRGVAGTRLEDAVVEALDADGNVIWNSVVTGAYDGSVHTFDVVITPDTAAPDADLADPSDGETVSVSILNSRGYIDVKFADMGPSGVNTSTITGNEITIGGDGVGSAVLAGTATLVRGTTYRYPFTGSFVAGPVDVSFVADTWEDNAGNNNIAGTDSFTVQADRAGTVTTIRVRLTDTDYLQLDEVQVLEAETGTNLALTGTAVQSSTYDSNAVASKANDGNSDAGYPVSGAITNLEFGASWRVDFGRAVDVAQIIVHNRHAAGSRLEDAIIEALDAGGNVVWSSTVTGAHDGSIHSFDVVISSGIAAPAMHVMSATVRNDDNVEDLFEDADTTGEPSQTPATADADAHNTDAFVSGSFRSWIDAI